MGMVFHTETLKGTSFAQEKFWDRLLAVLCVRDTTDPTWDGIFYGVTLFYTSVFNNSFSWSCGSSSVYLQSMVNLLW